MKKRFLLCLPVLLLAAGGCKQAPASSGQPSIRAENGKAILEPGSPAAASISTEAGRAPERSLLQLNGRIVWNDNATTRLFTPLAGRVTKIHVEVGQSVQSGDALASIASPDYGQAQADARRAATDLVLVERTLARTKELFAHGAAAAKDLEAAEADADRARLEKQRTAERLALYGGASEGVDQAYIFKAPIAGVVVEKNINPGFELRSDQMLANAPQLAAPLFVITDPTRLWIQIDVPERSQARVRAGQSFTVQSLSLPGHSFTGRVDVVSDSLDPATRTVKMRGTLANPERLLKAEMFVKAAFELEPEQGVEIPAQSVFLRGDKHCVLVEESAGQFVRREVTLGSEQKGRVIVTAGVQAGEKVVLEGAMLLEQVIEDAGK